MAGSLLIRPPEAQFIKQCIPWARTSLLSLLHIQKISCHQFSSVYPIPPTILSRKAKHKNLLLPSVVHFSKSVVFLEG